MLINQIQQTLVNRNHSLECNDGELRLVDGTAPHHGRLEICQANVWGTICNHGWDINDAMVACHQLGINTTGIYCFSMHLFLVIWILIWLQLCMWSGIYKERGPFYFLEFHAEATKPASWIVQMIQQLFMMSVVI